MALPDILEEGLAVVFVGINPSPRAAATGHRFAGPTNRFWRVLNRAGFTPSLLLAEDDQSLSKYGCGLISTVARPTRRADELSRAELFEAGGTLRRKIERYRPAWVSFIGKRAYSAITKRGNVVWGRQPEAFGGSKAWVVPDPSGLNRYTLEKLTDAYRELRVAAGDDFRAFEEAAPRSKSIARQRGESRSMS